MSSPQPVSWSDRQEECASLIRLDPIDGLVVASDPQRPRQRFAPDHVISVGPASRTLAAVTIRRQTSTALDLCCGSGIQALLAARHCKHVVGTDLNPRALRLAVLSAALSGVENVEWRLGDLLEPVESNTFDLVVSNPPFVVSPAHEFMYRDGGRRSDDLSHRVLAGMMGVLSDGGFGHLLCSWVNRAGEHWTDAPRRWVEGSGCDALILRLSSETPETYAISWTSSESSSADEAVDRALRVDHLLPRPADHGDHNGRDRRAPPSRAELGRGRGAHLGGLGRR